MPITAASIEDNGWVLRLDISASLGSFASYTLDPDGTPRVTLTSDHAGFAPSGGQAVAATLNRTLIGTKPLRVAAEVVGTALQPARIDETDLGGGVIRVRIALSEHVYATDTNIRLAVAAGWRTGESAASAIVVTNNSTTVAPIPIMRWALPQLSVVSGAVRLSMLVMSHHPNGFQPIAGIKFTITDGTTVKTAWTTALGTDNSMGDNLRCYTVDVDPSTATALTAGLLRCDAEVYPWLGAMRPTDAAGTRSMTGLRAAALSVDPASPFVVGYDPANTRYNAMFAYVDPVNGTVTAAAGMVQTTLAGAKAVAAASRPRDINTALQAGYLFNRTLAAANGQAAITRSVDAMQIVLAPGTHADGCGSTAVTFGLNATELPVRIVGDPDDANPRANCILQIQASRLISRPQRMALQRLTWEIGGASMTGTTQEVVLIDDCIVRGKAGLETNVTAPTGGVAPTAGNWNMAITRTKWWRNGAEIANGNMRLSLLRACEHSRFVTVLLCAVKNRVIPPSEDTTLSGTQTGALYRGWLSPTLAIQAEDLILAYNDARSWGGRIWVPSILPAATAGTPNPSIRRFAVVGNLFERIGASPEPFYSTGENELVTMSYNIVDGNTFVGDRANSFYSDPPASTMAMVNTSLNQAFVNRIANNIFDWLPTKHDDFQDTETSTTRVANGGVANGYRPHMIAAWSMLYGVCHEGNVDHSRATGAPAFQLQYSGRRSLTGYAAALTPGYTSDRSKLGTNAGGGDYRPTAGAPMLERVLRGQCDVDLTGIARTVPADAGALELVQAGLELTAGITTTALTVVGAARGLDAAGVLALGGDPAAGAARGLEISASLGVATVVTIGTLGPASPWSIRFGGTVALGDAAAGLSVDLAAMAVITARLRIGASLAAGLAATASLSADLSAPNGFGVDLFAVAGIAATLQTGVNLAATITAGATIAAPMQTGAGLFAALVNSVLLAADLDTAWPAAATLVTAASLSADLVTGKTLAAQIVVGSAINARLFTRPKFPDEPGPYADRPRAYAAETLDALIWRVTGFTSIEAVLAANPGLADLGPHLPEGLAVDLSPASDATTIAATATRTLVQLWD